MSNPVFKNPWVRALGVLLALALLALGMFFLRSVLIPLFVAFIVAYIFNPLINKIETRKVPRMAAILGLLAIIGVLALSLPLVVLPGMIERGSGDIVATASMAGLTPIALDPIYGLTKHGVIGFIRSLAASVSADPDHPDICVSAICPGFTDTNIISDGAKAHIDMLGLDIMSAEHVAGVVTQSLDVRLQGAQWVIWPGVEPRTYEWHPVLSDEERGI